jgi:gliding motility-associated-like protein
LNGDGGVSYSWSGVDASGNAISNGVSFVPPGSTTTTYAVTGTDGNSCSNTSSIDVISTALPTINATIANIYNGYGVSCEGNNDGAIQTNVQGGKAPYTYNWNNGSNSATLSNLSEGTYIVIVEDSNGCLSTDSITIDEPSALSYLYVVEDVTCYDEQDGKIELYPTGGVAPYTISWFDGSSLNYLNNLSNAYYSFTIIDANNCSTIDSIQVYEPADLFITVDTIKPTCERINDGEIDAFIYGGTYPYSYTLNGSPVDLPLDSVAVGNYVLTVEDSNSCTQTIVFNLTPLQPSCFMTPNMYSPNYDGYNDVFTISHSSWSSYTMNIYNSIGQLVYSGSSSTAYWDGLTNGAPMPTGDYYYQLITNEGEVIYGYVTLIR